MLPEGSHRSPGEGGLCWAFWFRSGGIIAKVRDLRQGALAQLVPVGVIAVLEPGLATSLLQGAAALLTFLFLPLTGAPL